MTEEIIVALITGSVTLLGVLSSNNKHDAVIDTKLEDLTAEVRKHNNFAEKIPVLESQIGFQKQRLDNLEQSLNNLK